MRSHCIIIYMCTTGQPLYKPMYAKKEKNIGNYILMHYVIVASNSSR